jgi:urea transport system ATP-binding protein
VNVALNLAERAVFMEKGEVRFEGATAELLERPDILRSVFIAGANATQAAADVDSPDIAAAAAMHARRSVADDAEVVLECHGILKRFGGITAVDDVDMELRDGEILGLIGPNGAGKTTLMDLLSGKVRLESGRVRFLPRPGDTTARAIDVTRHQKHQLVRLGIGRKFQAPSVYRSLTCYENIEVALGFRSRLPRLLLPLSSEARERIYGVLEQVGLAERSQALAGSLSHGEQQWLEIALLLVQDPPVLLLDEPVAGMTRRERERTGALLHSLEGRHSIIVTEHDMEFVREFSRTVTVLHQGRILAEDTVDVIQSDPAVIEVYLGRSHVAA